MSDEQDVEIRILVGANCRAALEPLEIVHSQNGGPYAHRSTLGRCVVGPMSTMVGVNAVTCNRVMVYQSPTARAT